MAARPPLSPVLAALLLAAAGLIGAWIFQYGLGYQPCKLCMLQRWPYYVGLPLGLVGLVLLGIGQRGAGQVMLGLFALAFAIGAGISVYHAGVEWKFWEGPTDCSGALNAMPASVGDLRKSLATTKVIRCDEAPLRILGLSFAGWNVVLSGAVVMLLGAAMRRQGGRSA